MADWVAISSLATAGGTLALAGATLTAVRSANRSSRVAERTLLAGLRPVLMPSRLQDPAQKIHFADGKWLTTLGGGGCAEATDEAVYRLSRDLYVPVSDIGFWQGAFREPGEPEFAEARKPIEAREAVTVDVLYGDHEGGQRAVTRFALSPTEDGAWMASAVRHWNIDREDPR